MSALPALDHATSTSFEYPLNVPLRTYQHAIVTQALVKNTLVSLPTGLGKTFIAATVMHNFRRWFPDGIVLFMAPTKPLVAQQLDACQKLLGVSRIHMAELTGHMAPSVRARARARDGLRRARTCPGPTLTQPRARARTLVRRRARRRGIARRSSSPRRRPRSTTCASACAPRSASSALSWTRRTARPASTLTWRWSPRCRRRRAGDSARSRSRRRPGATPRRCSASSTTRSSRTSSSETSRLRTSHSTCTPRT